MARRRSSLRSQANGAIHCPDSSITRMGASVKGSNRRVLPITSDLLSRRIGSRRTRRRRRGGSVRPPATFPRCDGVFLVALGMGLLAIDRVEAREPRWPRGLGLAFVGIGLVSGLATSGLLSSTWFALLLIAAGGVLLWRRREAAAFPPQVRGGPGPEPRPEADDPARKAD